MYSSTLNAGAGGNVLIETGKLSLLNGSQIYTGVEGNKDAGSLTIKASETVELVGSQQSIVGYTSSALSTTTDGSGNAGKLTIETPILLIQDGGYISTTTLGAGKAGELIIKAPVAISLIGNTPDGLNASVITSLTKSTGNASNIQINTGKLTVKDGGYISTQTLFGEGSGGNLNITATDSIEVSGNRGLGGNPSSLSAQTSGGGNAGNIQLNTNSLIVKNGGNISSQTSGKGSGGNVDIRANFSVNIEGENSVTTIPSKITTESSSNSEGNAGNISLTTGKLTIRNRGEITALTNSIGKAGSININSDNILIESSGTISANTSNSGDAGTIDITSKKLTLNSFGLITTQTTNSGNAGSIIINAPEFVNIGENSKINVETSAAGKPGDINITTDRLNIGEDAQLSATATATSTNTQGGGSINLDVNDLNISGKLGIFAETNSATPAGDLTINPLNPNLNINFTENGFISASTTAIGDGGNITITAPETIEIQGLGKISVETSGAGNAGNINFESKNLNIDKQTEISASTTGEGTAGSININVDNLNLTGNASIKTDTFASGDAGNINLNVTDNLNLNNSRIAASTGENSTGKGGSIFIDPNTVNLTNSTIAVSSQGLGTGGNIELTANTLNLDNSAISAETNSTDGGSIDLNIQDNLNLSNASEITATAGKAQGAGDGGNIKLNADFIINYPDNNKITANAFAGNGGNINITTNGILGSQYLDITASSELGLQGEVNINIPKTDPTSGLLPTKKPAIDIAELFARDFCKLSEDSSFVYIGKGGRLLTIDDTTDPDSVIINWVDNPYSGDNQNTNSSEEIAPEKSEKTEEIPEIRQAQGWIKLPDGRIVLTAHPVEVTPMGVKLLLPNCN